MTFNTLLKTIRPLWLAAGVLLYALGSSVARFLGTRNGSEVVWPGLGFAVLMLASAFTLHEYFNFNLLPPAISQAEQRARLRYRSVLLAMVGTGLTVSASMALAIFGQVGMHPQVSLIMILMLLCSVAYATPPLRLAANGYGEFVLTLMISVLIPALGFVVLYEEMHRLLPMVTFPLAALQLAMQLSMGLPNYGSDLKAGRRTLLLRMGWERGMLMHNILVPLAFLLLSAAFYFGLPFVIGGQALLALPLGGVQLIMMRHISGGGKPNWRALTFNATALYAVTAYLLAFGFWAR